MNSKRYIRIIIITGWIVFFTINALAQVTIKVGGYHFPPFVEWNNIQYSGLTLDLLEQMNQFQKKYKFVFIPTSSKRRYIDFKTYSFDVLFFECIQWGWQNQPLESSRVFLKGGEVYITKKTPDKTQDFFSDFKGKSILGYLGYHYGFANFNADEQFLKSNYNAEMTLSHDGNIRAIVKGRADIAVITISYLKRFLLTHPEVNDQILISDKKDQIYNHTILMRKHGPISATDMNLLLDDLEKNSILPILFKKYGITPKK